MMCPLLVLGRKHVEFRLLPQARAHRMEDHLKRKFANDDLTFCLAGDVARTPRNLSSAGAAVKTAGVRTRAKYPRCPLVFTRAFADSIRANLLRFEIFDVCGYGPQSEESELGVPVVRPITLREQRISTPRAGRMHDLPHGNAYEWPDCG
jgi:hypothetical protein